MERRKLYTPRHKCRGYNQSVIIVFILLWTNIKNCCDQGQNKYKPWLCFFLSLLLKTKRIYILTVLKNRDLFAWNSRSCLKNWALPPNPAYSCNINNVCNCFMKRRTILNGKFTKYNIFSVEIKSTVVAVCSGLTLLSTICQPYHDGVWLRQGAQCSLL